MKDLSLAYSLALVCVVSVGGCDLKPEEGNIGALSGGGEGGSGGDADESDEGAFICDGTLTADIGEAPISVLLVIDRSGSMNEQVLPTEATTRWDVVNDALFDSVNGLVPQFQFDVKIGMALYTGQDSRCPNLVEVVPDYGNRAALESGFPATPVTAGTTPTGEALSVVVPPFAEIDDGTAKVVILATDGEPDTCARTGDLGLDDGRAASLAAVEAAYDLGIRTYVISLAEGISEAHLQELANAGLGSPDDDAPFFRAESPGLLASTLNAIVEDFVPCQFAIGGQVDASQTCVGTVTLNGTDLECGVDWQVENSDRLVLLGDSCAEVQSGAPFDLDVEFPCGAFDPVG